MSPSKVISSAEGHFKHHEKATEETILEFLKPFTDGLKVHAASSRHLHCSLPHSRIHPRNTLCTLGPFIIVLDVGDRLGSPRTLHTHCGRMRSCMHIERRSASQGRGGPAPPNPKELFRALQPLRVRLLVPTTQRPPLRQRRPRRALGETAEVGGLFGCCHASASRRKHVPHTVDFEQLATAAASGQQNDDDTASQLATWDLVASSFGHRRHTHGAPRRRLPITAARGRRVLVPSRGRRRLG